MTDLPESIRQEVRQRADDHSSYIGRDKLVTVSYYQLPHEVFADAETLPKWIRKACAMASRSRKKQKSSRVNHRIEAR